MQPNDPTPRVIEDPVVVPGPDGVPRLVDRSDLPVRPPPPSPASVFALVALVPAMGAVALACPYRWLPIVAVAGSILAVVVSLFARRRRRGVPSAPTGASAEFELTRADVDAAVKALGDTLRGRGL